MPNDKHIVKPAIKANDVYTNYHTVLGKKSWEEFDSWFKKIVTHDEFFNIEKLPVKPLTIDNIYDSEDDFRTPSTESREAQFLKMGKLLIFCQNHGKGGFLLGIKLKDEANRSLKDTPLFFRYDGSRYPLFHFNDLMPFSLNQLDITATLTPRQPIKDELKAALNTIRTLLTQFALAKDVSPAEIEQFRLAEKQINQSPDPSNEPGEAPLKLFDKALAVPPSTDKVAQLARQFELEFKLNDDDHPRPSA